MNTIKNIGLQNHTIGHKKSAEYVKIIILVFLFLYISSCKSVLCGANTNVNVEHKSGSAHIELKNLTILAPANSTKLISVNYSGRVVTPTGSTGVGTFSISKSYEVTRTSVTPASVLDRLNLMPGTWEVKILIGDWNTTCSGNIGENNSTNFVFTYPQAGCSVQ
jgi:hypothetical protein